ncbi:MAG: glutamate--tRNA ligase [Pseudomonadota bacterium]
MLRPSKRTANVMTVRTRIAPSPTGDPHVGTAYMALFNWALARQAGGQFVLRIEDTDQERSTQASEAAILESLRWLGLDWDEGPDVGGDYGPYRQSERLALYRRYVDQLIEQGVAFVCFCTRERLDALRAEQRACGETQRYDGHCADLPADEVKARIAAGEPHVVRMRVPDEGTCRFEDALRGPIEIPFAQIDMQVLLKSDGFPTYHLAVVVDDHLMGITHIVRGEEWINSVPKHVLLYEYFGWDAPTFVHMPLLRNPDQSKLSKRKNPTSVSYYREAGFLPEALANYLGTMGFSMPDERDLFSRSEFAEAMSIDRITLGGPIFDPVKLRWMNGQYLRALSDDDFVARVKDWMINDDRLRALLPLVKERTEQLSDLVPQVAYLIGDRGDLAAEAFSFNGLPDEQVPVVLHHYLTALDQARSWDRELLFDTAQQLASFLELKLKVFLHPVFLAVSGKPVSLPLFDSMVFLGSDITRVRLREALAIVGVSKKQQKKLDKSFEAFQRSRVLAE